MSLSLRRMLARMYPTRTYTVDDLHRFSHSENPREIVRQGSERGLVRWSGSKWVLTSDGVHTAQQLRDSGQYPELPERKTPRPAPLRDQEVEKVVVRRDRPKPPPLTITEKVHRRIPPTKYLTGAQVALLRCLYENGWWVSTNKRTTDTLLRHELVRWISTGVLTLTDLGTQAAITLHRMENGHDIAG